MIYKILRFFKSLFWHIYSGSPKSSQDLIDSRHAICEGCDKFDKSGSQCLVCGCSINKKKIFMNKLAWLDQKCPEGKW
jgi:hypothetical protein